MIFYFAFRFLVFFCFAFLAAATATFAFLVYIFNSIDESLLLVITALLVSSALFTWVSFKEWQSIIEDIEEHTDWNT